MRRLADAMRAPSLLLCGLLWLAGCATTRVSREPLSIPAQETVLRGLAGFRLEGTASVQVGEDAVQPTVSWRQSGAESRFRFSGLLGLGLSVEYGPQILRLTSSRGEDLTDAEAEQALSTQLGFVPPFEALRFWVLGLPAPGEPPTEQSTDDAGRVNAMTQRQWRIHYELWTDVATPAGVARLPKRLVVTRADLRLKLFVKRWVLVTGN
jgi:outer membrane lipoprotein LolB